MPFADPERRREYHRAYMKRWRAKGKPPRVKVTPQPRDRREYNARLYLKRQEIIREAHRVDRALNPDKYRVIDVTQKARRKALISNAPVIEPVDPNHLYERDHGICHICRTLCARAEASVDHVIPLSRGGEHSYRNTALAHRRCNSRKGNRLVS